MRLTLMILGGLVLLAAIGYGGDALVVLLRAEPYSTVQINRYYVVPEKFGKEDYSIAPPVMERCVHALLPHSGSQPCWYLESHQLRLIRVGF